jgi:hypothetical protein
LDGSFRQDPILAGDKGERHPILAIREFIEVWVNPHMNTTINEISNAGKYFAIENAIVALIPFALIFYVTDPGVEDLIFGHFNIGT